MARWRKMMLAVAILALPAITGCGGDDEGSEEDPATNGTEDAAIVIESPEGGATVTSPVEIAGTASVFEGTVQLRILDAEGTEVGRGFATASAGAPERGDFSEELEFTVDEAQEGTVEAFEESAADPSEGGGDANTVSVPVQLEP
jgi:hypothetical protein